MSDETSHNPRPPRNERHDRSADRPADREPRHEAGRPERSDGRSENRSEGRSEGRSPSKDITPVLRGWDYEPGTINVRKVTGQDGSPKIQMRLDLGLLQMEVTGRPDGVRPHGCESLLDYFEDKLADHRRRNGTELGFQI